VTVIDGFCRPFGVHAATAAPVTPAAARPVPPLPRKGSHLSAAKELPTP